MGCGGVEKELRNGWKVECGLRMERNVNLCGIMGLVGGKWKGLEIWLLDD